MGFLYTVSGAHLSLVPGGGAGTIITLVSIHPLATVLGQHIKIHRMWASQDENATSAMVRVSWGFKEDAQDTVASATPVGHNKNAPTAAIHGGTDGATGHCGVNASAQGAGAYTVIGTDAFNALNGWLWIPTPDERIELQYAATTTFVLCFPVSATTTAGWNFGVTFEEC